MDGSGPDAQAADQDGRRLARAPLLAAYTSHDRSTDCWILLLLSHHIIMDNSTVQVLHQEIEAHRLGQGDRLPPAAPHACC